MAIIALNFVRDLWPFSYFRYDDLRVSDCLVKKLAIPENTKRFVYAIQEPQTRAVVYVLCVQNLSENSALDAECLIRAVEPEAVVVQIGPAINIDDDKIGEDDITSVSTWSYYLKSKIRRVDEDPMPTSPFEVVKRCFVYRYNKKRYEDVAGNLVLKEIFGVGFDGHFLAAKRAAKEVGASFLLLDSPFVKCNGDGACSLEIKQKAKEEKEEEKPAKKFDVLALGVQPVFQRGMSMVPRRRFSALNDVQIQMVKSIGLQLFDSGSDQKLGSENVNENPPRDDYEAPHFSQSIYPLLVDLHDLFSGIPHIGRALGHAQKMLSAINIGEAVEAKLLTEVYVFRSAVEALRIALNNASRLPVNKSSNNEFSVLSIEDKSHALTAQAVRSQTSRFKAIVVLVDANGLAGLRRHWDTRVPSEVKDMVQQLVTAGDDDEKLNRCCSKLLPSPKPVIAIGAGATAVLGAASLSNFVQASTLAKISSLKLPASVKLLLTQASKVVSFTAGKTAGPSAVMGPEGLIGAKVTALKAATTAEKIRAVAHSIIASVEKTSVSAIRTAFYEIMRRRNQPIGLLPWAAFGSSIAACSGIFMYGDGIECAVESVPAASSIASLGRGVHNLHQASQSIWLAENSGIQKSVASHKHKFWQFRVQQ